MTRPPLPCLLLSLALALAIGGCGTKSSGTGLGSALSYVPKGAPLVVAVDTNPDGGQWQQVNTLLGRFPFGGQVKQAIKDRLKSGSTVSYENDIKPLLGNDLVFAVTASPSGGSKPYLFAWKVKDEGVAKRLVRLNAIRVGTLGGADVYRSQAGGAGVSVVKDSTVVAARTQADLAAALNRASGAGHMTESDFDAALGGLDTKALVRVTGNLQTFLAGPQAAAARKVPWLAALRTFGATISADSDGIGAALRVKTGGALGARDLPLAVGAQAAPVVLRAGEVGIGIRNLAQIVKFAEAASRVTDPTGFAKSTRDKAKFGRQLGIDVDRDLVSQLTGNSTFSVALDGGFAFRAGLRDPAAASATLRKAAPKLKKLGKHRAVVTAPANGTGLYTLATADGKRYAFGVIGKSFVLATDASRAAQFAGESASTVPGASGAVVLASDARALANAIAQQRGQGAAAQLVTGALGEMVGSLEAETGGLSGNFKLKIK
jgi:hypothetical protein